MGKQNACEGSPFKLAGIARHVAHGLSGVLVIGGQDDARFRQHYPALACFPCASQ